MVTSSIYAFSDTKAIDAHCTKWVFLKYTEENQTDSSVSGYQTPPSPKTINSYQLRKKSNLYLGV